MSLSEITVRRWKQVCYIRITVLITELSHWQRLARNLLVRRARVSLGSSKLNCSWQHFITSMLLVLKSFIKNLLITKSIDRSCDLFKGQATRPYRSIEANVLVKLMHSARITFMTFNYENSFCKTVFHHVGTSIYRQKCISVIQQKSGHNFWSVLSNCPHFEYVIGQRRPIPQRNTPVHTGQNKHQKDKWNVLCKQWRIPDFERQGRTGGSRLRIQRWIHWREQGAKPWETKDRSEPPEAEQFCQRGTQLCSTYSKFHGQSAIKSPDKISESSYTSPESATLVTCQRPAGPVSRLLKK